MRPLISRTILSILVIVMVLVPVALYGFKEMRTAGMAKFFATMKMPPLPVETAVARVTDFPQTLAAIGTLQAVHQVTVAPEIGGRVVKIFFEPGSPVHAGDPLVQLNDGPEQGDLANFEAQQHNAELSLKRGKELVGRQFETQANIDLLKSQLDQSAAMIAKTQAQIAQKLIRAPFDGELGIRQVDLGEFINPGGAIISLTDLDELFVNFSLPEQARGQIYIGQDVDLTVDAYPAEVFHAQITTIDPQVNTDTRNISLQALAHNADHRLLPGMAVKLSIHLPSLHNQIVVPETAVDYSLYGDAIFVVDQVPGSTTYKVRRVYIMVGDHQKGDVDILDGLKSGDRVVKSGQIRLIDGASVTLDGNDNLPTSKTVPRD